MPKEHVRADDSQRAVEVSEEEGVVVVPHIWRGVISNYCQLSLYKIPRNIDSLKTIKLLKIAVFNVIFTII